MHKHVLKMKLDGASSASSETPSKDDPLLKKIKKAAVCAEEILAGICLFT